MGGGVPHEVQRVAIVGPSARRQDWAAAAVECVSVKEPEVVPKLVPHPFEVEVAVDPRLRWISANCGHTRPGTGVSGKRVDVPRVTGKGDAGRRGGLLRQTGQCERVADRAAHRDSEPAEDVAREPRLLIRPFAIKVARRREHDSLGVEKSVRFNRIVLEVHQQNQGRLAAEGVRPRSRCRDRLHARRAGVERQHVVEEHAAQAHAIARLAPRRSGSEVERDPHAARGEEVAQASAIRVVLLQHLERPLELHVLFDIAAYGSRQARTKLG